MRRRDFIALVGASAAWPLAAQAQQPQMKRVGYLAPNDSEEQAIATGDGLRRGIRSGLAKQGWVEPRVSIETRYAGLAGAQIQQARCLRPNAASTERWSYLNTSLS